jgi:hypothetical protein
MSDTYAAYDHSKNNQAEISRSLTCACFNCYAEFPANQVIKWTEQTAWCPSCEAYSTVLGDASGLPLERDFLNAVHDHWIGQQEEHDAMAAETHKQTLAALANRQNPSKRHITEKGPQGNRSPWWKLW